MMKRPRPNRIDRLRQLMKAEGVDALLVTKRENVRYLTGFTGSAGSVLIASGRPWLITDFRYNLQARQETSGLDNPDSENGFPLGSPGRSRPHGSRDALVR